MKKLIAVLAVLTLFVGGMVVTRCYFADKDSFKKYLENHEGVKGEQISKIAGSCDESGFLWVTESDKSGKAVATNVFGIWFKRGEITPVVDPPAKAVSSANQ